METDIRNDAPVENEEEIDELAPMRDEIESLVELIKDKVDNDNLTPCPGCNILVEISANRCPHCDSNIAANNALMRESIRRLDEIRGELDGEHDVHVESRLDPSEKQSFGERIRRFFSGAPVEEDLIETPPELKPDEPRLFDTIAVGDTVKVLEAADPWYKVKTRDGKTGWVYSTVLRDR
jgi:hypothetical protein